MGKPSNKGPSLHVIMDSHGNKLGTFTLHSVRRDPPPPPPSRRQANAVPSKMYIVDPRGFRHLVQKLTGAPRAAATATKRANLRDVAPPALRLPRSSAATVAPLPEGLGDNSINNVTLPLLPASLDGLPENFESSFAGGYLSALPVPSPLLSFSLLSPGTLASLNKELECSPTNCYL